MRFKTLNSEYVLDDQGDGAFLIVKGNAAANLGPGTIVRLNAPPVVGRMVLGVKVNGTGHEFHTSRVTEVIET